jgi:hypothetical protein
MLHGRKTDKEGTMSGNEPNSRTRARRYFLGLAGAAAAMFPLVVEAKGKKWRKQDGKPKGKSEGNPMCFLRGTSIKSPTGEVCIEDLRPGDLVETVRGEAKAIKWIGHSVYKRGGQAWNNSVTPIRVARRALDERTPHKDLYLSPGHALFIDGVLIRAKELVNGISIAPVVPTDRETIEYFHIILDSHDVILAEGAPAETFQLQERNHEDFTNFADFARLYPFASHTAMTPCAPIVSLASGREHLKALLPSPVRRAFQMREPVRDTFERIATRAAHLVS